MNLLAKHQKLEQPELLCTYTAYDKPPVASPLIPTNLKITNEGIRVENKIWRGEVPHMTIRGCIFLLISIIGLISFVESGWVYVSGFSVKFGFFERYSIILYVLALYCSISIIGIKMFARRRHFIFAKDCATLYCAKLGIIKYDLKDIKFHLIKCTVPWELYYIEIEVQSNLLESYQKMMLIEMSARRETADGMLAVLLPCLRGDSQPLNSEKKRRYFSIPKNEKPSIWRRITNLEAHFVVWFNCYMINRLLSWLIRGNRRFKNPDSM